LTIPERFPILGCRHLRRMKALLQLNQLRYFHAVSRTKSIRKAAETLNVAQSAVSRQIKNLEEELGVPLFDRQPRGVRLTDAGQVLARYAQQTMMSLERVRSEIDDLRALRRGTVNLSTVEAGVLNVVPEVAADFRRRYPAVRLAVWVRGSRGVVDMLLGDDADLGLAFNAPAHPDIEVVARREQQLYAVVSPGHRLAGVREARMEDLAGEALAVPDTSFGIRRLVDEMQLSAGIRIEPVLVTDSIQLLASFARLSLGVACLPFFAIAGDVDAGRVVAVPLADALARAAGIDLMVHRGRRLPLAAELFLESLRGALEKLR
jgi:DNA-binding transcriptional LysR family regulator